MFPPSPPLPGIRASLSRNQPEYHPLECLSISRGRIEAGRFRKTEKKNSPRESLANFTLSALSLPAIGYQFRRNCFPCLILFCSYLLSEYIYFTDKNIITKRARAYAHIPPVRIHGSSPSYNTRNFPDTDASSSLLRSFQQANLFEIPTRYMNHVCLYSFMRVYARSCVYIVHVGLICDVFRRCVSRG